VRRQATGIIAGYVVCSTLAQRGNNRQNIFLLDEDRRFYIEVPRAKPRQYGLTILGYCLMTNHVRWIAIPKRPHSLAEAVGQTHWRYTMHFNKSTARRGHLWQNRFYSCTLGPSHLVAAPAYADLNPVRAALATHVLLRSLVPSGARFDHPQRTCRTSAPAFAYLLVDDQVG